MFWGVRPAPQITTAMSVPAHPQSQLWHWHNFPIHYQTAGTTGPVLVLIHGFGASTQHWRRNIEGLAQAHRVYAIDLIGFGQSAKPQPGPLQPGQQIPYQFETWGAQIVTFCREVVGSAAFLVGNSIGSIVAMQAAVQEPTVVEGLVLLNCSLRLLHDRKRSALPWYRQLGTVILQTVLAYRPLGHFFFQRLAQPQTVRNILRQAYGRTEAVTDELVAALLQPAADPGAADVFLAFIQYSQGPLPEDLLPQLSCPALMVWGQADPWEPVELGRCLAKFPAVDKFIVLEGVGHCPQDEAPELVNPIVEQWIATHRNPAGSSLAVGA
jgi:pimeloyl-ACP methyl ester carboxylesterase